ncbi:hypothetical protein CLV58_109245 [Spirosoma oryzae]|uniref:Uncharacterized protein n=1 Tax=Spirosoma oryzae TaxID=1469603 RepID=A0A2T0SYM9_9BACT|nr:hypothetical protein [Spirosoma oryzae]PRY38518.1 hypothetical protein CLV58_109245 [Spirosoma oryzae]
METNQLTVEIDTYHQYKEKLAEYQRQPMKYQTEIQLITKAIQTYESSKSNT